MKVTLISATMNAKEILIFTKNTRLKMSPEALDEVATMSGAEKMVELEYMARTIPSSWEFVDYIFVIEGVTRAFTHQFVRTRNASFAQQTMRVLDMAPNGAPFNYLTGPTVEATQSSADAYHDTMSYIADNYTHMIANGTAIEDARGILPTNILTNIVAKFNLRTLAEIFVKRGNIRTQGEYRDVMAAMKEQVYKVHPWADLFLEPRKHSVVSELEKIAADAKAAGMDGIAARVAKEAGILQLELDA